ncbi:MAG: HesB/IscA family protein [Planctomycetaceae bacterium]
MSTCTMPSAPATSVGSIVIITEKAAGEMNRVLSDKKLPESTVLRIGVAGGGCSGFSYSLGFDDKCDEMNDVVSEQHGLKVAVDRKSALYLEGTTIDFYDGIERRGFTFDNPNSKKSCGCGSSFSV